MSLQERRRCPPGGPEPFCDHGEAFFKVKIKRVETRSDRLKWDRRKNGKVFFGNWNYKRLTAYIVLIKNGLKRLTGFLTGHCLLGKPSRNLNLVEDASDRFYSSDVMTLWLKGAKPGTSPDQEGKNPKPGGIPNSQLLTNS